jgi:hypothetical protein
MFQIGSMHTTLLASIVRLLSVIRPLRVHVMLSKPRVILACVVVLTWSLALTSFELTWRACIMAKGVLSLDCLGW